MSADTLTLPNETPSALPAGTRLGEFELKRVLGIGGFGIVYLAFDHALERDVAVKEYMPASLAGRTQTMHVSLRSASDAETFALGLRSFVNEARLLARFDHPSLLKVYRFWEANGTAYMAMPVLRGRTLKQVRKAMQGPPDERWLRDLLDPLLGAIERLHAEGVYHRDIAPDNVQIDPDGQPVLMDFGAARRVIGDKSQALTAILKPSYAPIEQYGDTGAVRQGPWTDLYALGATLHYLLLSRPPVPATARTLHDEPSALTAAALPGISAGFLHLVQWMLAPRPADRPQSVADVRDVLAGRTQPPRPRAADPAPRTPTPWEATRLLQRAAPADIDLPLEGTPARSAPAWRTPAPQSLDPSATRLHSPPAGPPHTPPRVSAAPAGPAAPAAAAARKSPPDQRRHRGLQAVLTACGAAALGLSLAAYALWPSAVADPAPVAATLPAAVSVVAPVAPPVAEPAAALPSAESTIATVVVPAPLPLPAAAEKAGGKADKPAALPRPAAADRAAVARPAAAGLPAVTPVAAARVPPVPAAALVPVVAPAPAPATAAAEGWRHAGPEAECSGRNPLRHFVCMERACLRFDLAAHPDCLRWRKEARRE